ncbi:MAG: transketolase C-terminal domain-containing protein, partial [Simkaniaceae bacterium]
QALQGGLGSFINHFIMQKGLSHFKVVNIGIPDTFIEHGSHRHLLEKFGITPEAIAKQVLEKMPKPELAL